MKKVIKFHWKDLCLPEKKEALPVLYSAIIREIAQNLREEVERHYGGLRRKHLLEFIDYLYKKYQ